MIPSYLQCPINLERTFSLFFRILECFCPARSYLVKLYVYFILILSEFYETLPSRITL
jgi:hypothetical protein